MIGKLWVDYEYLHRLRYLNWYLLGLFDAVNCVLIVVMS
jgi:hypothetical protein